MGVLCFVFYAYARARAGRLGADTHIILKGGSVVAAIVNALLHTCLMNLFFSVAQRERSLVSRRTVDRVLWLYTILGQKWAVNALLPRTFPRQWC